jgi:uncharacterized membrane protein
MFTSFVMGSLFFTNSYTVQAQVATEAAIATDSATPEATVSATIAPASPSAEVIQRIQEKKDEDITETTGKSTDKLVAFLESHPPGPLSWYNPLEHAIRYAVSQGLPPNILVLVLLFPLIASLIAASRHIIGLRGFGIYIPAVLAVALVSTGAMVGIIIFVSIVSVALLSKKVLKNLHLSYLPRTATLLWMISLAILGVLIAAPALGLLQLMSLNIFPILILVLLSENFLDAQASTKPSDAFWLAVETLGLAFVSGLALRLEVLRQFALLEPELLIIGTALFNILVGKFVGLRLTEFLRFKPIIEE